MLCQPMVDLETRHNRRDNNATIVAQLRTLQKIYRPQVLNVMMVAKYN